MPLYFELDGNFPNHEANPLEPGEPPSTCRPGSVETGADIGLAFDGDADRCFVVDERGELVSPRALTALIAARELAKHPGSTVIHNLITSRAVPEIVREHGGMPVRTRVGSLVHQGDDGRDRRGLRRGALRALLLPRLLAGRLGMLAALHALAALAEADAAAVATCSPSYRATSPPARSTPRSPTRPAVVDEIEQDLRRPRGVSVDRLDGLTVDATTTGGSTSARPTPSRCSGSTPRPTTRPPWTRVRDDVLA